MSSTSSECPLLSASFPDELLLAVIDNLPFTSTDASNNTIHSIVALSHTHPRLASLIRTYERSITKSIVHRELRNAPRDFPCAEENRGYAWVKSSVDGYNTIDAIMRRLMDPSNCVRPKDRDMASVLDGMFMLYQISSLHIPAMHARLATLPIPCLVSLYLSIHNTLLTARYYNEPSLIHQFTYGRHMDAAAFALRQEMSIAFCETCLLDGPRFMHTMLEDPPRAEPALLHGVVRILGRDWDDDVVAVVGGGNTDPQAVPVPLVYGPCLREECEGGVGSVWKSVVRRFEGEFGVEGEVQVERAVLGFAFEWY